MGLPLRSNRRGTSPTFSSAIDDRTQPISRVVRGAVWGILTSSVDALNLFLRLQMPGAAPNVPSRSIASFRYRRDFGVSFPLSMMDYFPQGAQTFKPLT